MMAIKIIGESVKFIGSKYIQEKSQIRQACDIPRSGTLSNKPKTLTETTPFVITYNPALPILGHIIHNQQHRHQ